MWWGFRGYYGVTDWWGICLEEVKPVVPMERSRSLTDRIGDDYGWLIAQFILLGLTFLSGPLSQLLGIRFELPWPRWIDIGAGIGLIAGALVVAGQARADLGDSLRVAPTPLQDAQLVDRGWYARVRHPLYLAVLIAVLGWTILWRSPITIAMDLILFLFLRRKATHEERLLVATYPDYASYKERVTARFVPRVW